MEIKIVNEFIPDLFDAFERLSPQLSSSNPAPSIEILEKIIQSDCTTLFIAENDGEIIGSLSLAVFQIPTGLRAWVEDVVVDEKARGKGVGSALCEAAIEEATRLGATTLDLTSRPSREAANRLYVSLGFEKRETNVYRYRIDN